MDVALRMEGLPALQLWDLVNTVLCEPGGDPSTDGSLPQISLVERIKLDLGVSMKYVGTAKQLADTLTKAVLTPIRGILY